MNKTFYNYCKSIRSKRYKIADMIINGYNPMEGLTMDSNIKKWYRVAYPTDPIYTDISDWVTFQDIYNRLKRGIDIYPPLAHDSIVREKVFEAISRLKGCDYNEIYNMWMKY